MTLEEIMEEAELKMMKLVDVVKSEFSSIRTGKASPRWSRTSSLIIMGPKHGCATWPASRRRKRVSWLSIPGTRARWKRWRKRSRAPISV